MDSDQSNTIDLAVETYHKSRAALIAEDRSLRDDHNPARLATLGPPESLKKAEDVIRKIRQDEALSVWAQESEEVPHIFPGMEFLTAKKTIQKTKLFSWIKKLPKGALLHAHMDAMCDAQFLLSEALKHPQMHVCAPEVVTEANILSVLPNFLAMPKGYVCQSEVDSVTDAEYHPETWMPLASARANFQFGGEAGFDKWVLRALRIDPEEAYKQYNTSKKIWTKFASTFGVSNGLLRFEPILASYYRELLRSSVEDGISYVEVRLNFFLKTMIRADGRDDFTHREWVISFEKAVRDFKEELRAQGREDEFVGAKIIYVTLRFGDLEELDWYLNDCIELKKEFPDTIAGFDVVGQEDIGRTLAYYAPKLLEFRARVASLGLSIPFIFHAGETLGDGDHVDENLYDAILLGSKRIGHGFSLAKHPILMRLCRQMGIAIEVCPISNEILRLTSSMPTHPLPILLNNGVPVALACDDPSVFGNMGLSYDFFQVLVASEVTGLATLGIMARQSIAVSSLNDEEKQEAFAKWDKKWTSFISEIIDSVP